MNEIQEKHQAALDSSWKILNEAEKSMFNFMLDVYDKRKDDPTRKTAILTCGQYYTGKQATVRIQFANQVDVSAEGDIVARVAFMGDVLLKLVGALEMKEVLDNINIFSERVWWECSVVGDGQQSNDRIDRTVNQASLTTDTAFFDDFALGATLHQKAHDLAEAKKARIAVYSNISKELNDLYDDSIVRLQTLFPMLEFVKDTKVLTYESFFVGSEKVTRLSPWKRTSLFLYSRDYTFEERFQKLITFIRSLKRKIKSVFVSADNLLQRSDEIFLFVVPSSSGKRDGIPRITSVLSKKTEASFMRLREVDKPEKKKWKNLKANISTFQQVAERILADSTHPGYNHTRQLLRTIKDNQRAFVFRDCKTTQSKLVGSGWYSLIAYAFDRDYLTCSKTILKGRSRYKFSFF